MRETSAACHQEDCSHRSEGSEWGKGVQGGFEHKTSPENITYIPCIKYVKSSVMHLGIFSAFSVCEKAQIERGGQRLWWENCRFSHSSSKPSPCRIVKHCKTL